VRIANGPHCYAQDLESAVEAALDDARMRLGKRSHARYFEFLGDARFRDRFIRVRPGQACPLDSDKAYRSATARQWTTWMAEELRRTET
jgi:hypothetical protein